MASEPSPFIENLINSRNRDISLFLPFILGLNATRGDSRSPPDRIVLINPFSQGMVVMDRSSGGDNSTGDDNGGGELAFESFLNELLSNKTGRPPASKASIDALESVEVEGGDGDQCVICLEEWESGEKAKRLPCKHCFHGECVERWLNIHGSCPVCRHEMPVDEGDDEKRRSGGERRREIWVSFVVGGERRSEEDEESVS